MKNEKNAGTIKITIREEENGLESVQLEAEASADHLMKSVCSILNALETRFDIPLQISLMFIAEAMQSQITEEERSAENE